MNLTRSIIEKGTGSCNDSSPKIGTPLPEKDKLAYKIKKEMEKPEIDPVRRVSGPGRHGGFS
jgi:hypothetical protein